MELIKQDSPVNHITNYEFSIGEVVTVGGNPNVLAEVLETSGEQLKVRILTAPEVGKIRYTTKFTYYTRPVPNVTAKEVRERLSALHNKDFISMPKSVQTKEPKAVVECNEEEVVKSSNTVIEETPTLTATVEEVDEKVIESMDFVSIVTTQTELVEEPTKIIDVEVAPKEKFIETKPVKPQANEAEFEQMDIFNLI